MDECDGDCESMRERRGIVNETGVQLAESEVDRLAKQPKLIPKAALKLEVDAQKNWDKFYNRNNDKFYKDRHWGHKELQEVCTHIDFREPVAYLEAGSGVGNMLFPLSACFSHWRFFAFDFSKNAIKILNERAAAIGLQVDTAVSDLTKEEQKPFAENSIDLATLIFVLSGIHPDKHVTAIRNLASMIKPGGTVVIRDYAAYDYAMLRFKPQNKIDERFYKRTDFTRAFYFHREELIEIFEQAGFSVVNCSYHHTYTENHQMNLKVDRCFLQGVFVKK